MNTQATILLVDDDPGILLTVGDRLELEGYAVIRASSGDEALQDLTTLVPDLIILDVSMPGLNGFAVITHLQNLASVRDCPVLIFSGRANLAPFFEGISVSAFLPKTTPPEQLIHTVRDLIQKRQFSKKKLAQQSLLLVEDDGNFRNRYARFFQSHGFLVHEADGRQVITDIAAQRQPDIILIKYMLSHHNGPSLANHLGSHPDTKHIPVVIYDETGIHHSGLPIPHVRAVVPSGDTHLLLRTVQHIIGIN